MQRQTIRETLNGSDVIVRSRTGTGKTLGFVIPVANKLVNAGRGAGGFANTQRGGKRNNRRNNNRGRRGEPPSALVMAPTRELALQVAREFERFAPYLRTTTVYGGASYRPQVQQLQAGVDVVVGTPGRLNDMVNQGVLQLSDVSMLVLDEADEMLKMGCVLFPPAAYARRAFFVFFCCCCCCGSCFFFGRCLFCRCVGWWVRHFLTRFCGLWCTSRAAGSSSRWKTSCATCPTKRTGRRCCGPPRCRLG